MADDSPSRKLATIVALDVAGYSARTEADIMGPDGYRTGLLLHAGMPELRNDPRFVKLCARLGLVEYWLATEKWPDCADEVPYDFRAECEKVRAVPVHAFDF